MLVAIFQVLAVSKSEPLAEAFMRLYLAFRSAGLGEPSLRFTLVDADPLPQHLPTRVSAVARAIKRHPELEPFAGHAAPIAGFAEPSRLLSNVDSNGIVTPVPFLLVEQIASGIPRSLPFATVHLLLSSPAFSAASERPIPENRIRHSIVKAGVKPTVGHAVAPGINIQDSWGVSSRKRSVVAMTTTIANDTDKQLPPPPTQLAALIAACGKTRRTMQQPISPTEPAYVWGRLHPLPPDRLLTVQNDYRARVETMAQAMPHPVDFQRGPKEPLQAGPQKPELQRCFTPLGYSCRGENGTFTLRRRTPANLTIELSLDVGTWSNTLTASYNVMGICNEQEFRLQIGLPPAPGMKSLGESMGWDRFQQIPIGGPDRWRHLVENLAALTKALDSSFAPDVDKAAGPSPPWYQPSSL